MHAERYNQNKTKQNGLYPIMAVYFPNLAAAASLISHTFLHCDRDTLPSSSGVCFSIP